MTARLRGRALRAGGEARRRAATAMAGAQHPRPAEDDGPHRVPASAFDIVLHARMRRERSVVVGLVAAPRDCVDTDAMTAVLHADDLVATRTDGRVLLAVLESDGLGGDRFDQAIAALVERHGPQLIVGCAELRPGDTAGSLLRRADHVFEHARRRRERS